MPAEGPLTSQGSPQFQFSPRISATSFCKYDKMFFLVKFYGKRKNAGPMGPPTGVGGTCSCVPPPWLRHWEVVLMVAFWLVAILHNRRRDYRIGFFSIHIFAACPSAQWCRVGHLKTKFWFLALHSVFPIIWSIWCTSVPFLAKSINI